LADRHVVAREGEEIVGAWFLSEGAAEIFHTSRSGASVVVKVVTAPTILSAPEMVADRRTYCAGVRAAGRSSVYGMTPSLFRACCAERDAYDEMVFDMALAFTGATLFEPSRLFETEAVLAALVLAYADVFGDRDAESGAVTIGLRRSQPDLADAIGAGDRSVNRILAAWRGEGLVDKRAGRYRLHDETALVDKAGELAGTLVHRVRSLGPR
jgi:CRP-like cAMP-binding protein